MGEFLFLASTVGSFGLGLVLLVYGPLRGMMGSRWVAPMCSLGVSLVLLSLVGWFHLAASLGTGRTGAITVLFAISLAVTLWFYWTVWRLGRKSSRREHRRREVGRL